MTPIATRFRFLALLISLVLPVVGVGPARGDILVTYDFATATADPTERTGPGFAPAIVDPDVTATDVSLSDDLPVPAEPFIADRDPKYGRPVLRIDPGPDSTSKDEAIAGGKFFEFTVTADPDFSLYLDSLTFLSARGGASTPRGWVLRSSVDDFASNIDTQLVGTQRPDLTLFTVDLSDPQFQDLSEVTFRIYTFVPFGGQSLEYVDVTLNGIVIPEVR
jgi:hypothetical protein